MTWNSPSYAKKVTGASPSSGVDWATKGQMQADAAVAIGGHRVVAVSNLGLIYADATDIALLGATVGVSLNAASPGQPVTYQESGLVAHAGWTWTFPADVFLTSAGNLVQPDPASTFSQRIGYAISATELYVDISEPIVL